MRFLLDANCWMQVIREREHASAVRDLVAAAGDENMATTDMALHSVVIAMGRFKMHDRVEEFFRLSGVGTTIELIRSTPKDLIEVATVAARLGLDVEDAYQYAAAQRHDLKLVSLDADFDRTPNGRLTPATALQLFKDESTQPRQTP